MGVKDIEAGLHPDKTKVRIMIGERTDAGPKELAQIDIDAGQLESFIRNLAAMRAEMSPEVPKRLDPGRPIFKDSTLEPRTMVGSTRLVTGEGVFLALRHAGYGWLAWGFTIKELGPVMQGLAETVNRIAKQTRIIIR